MKVLMIDPFGRGGPPYYTYGLCKGLSENGIDVSLITETDYELREWQKPFPVYELLFVLANKLLPKKSRLKTLVKAAEYAVNQVNVYLKARALNVRIVHLQWCIIPWLDMILIKMLRSKGIQVVLTAHNILPHDSGDRYKSVLKRLYSLVDGIIVHGDNLKKELLGTFPELSPEKVRVFEHGSYDFFSLASEEELRNFKHKHAITGQRIILFFGFIRPYKGLDYLIEAFSRIDWRGLNCKLLVAGNPLGGFETYQRQIDNLGVSPGVALDLRYIPLEEMAIYFQAADLVVLPYTHASQSGVLQSAYSNGKPVVVTDCGGLPEAVDGSGLVVPPADAGALAEAINKLIANDTLRDNMGKQAELLGQTRFSWLDIAKRTADFYDDLMRK